MIEGVEPVTSAPPVLAPDSEIEALVARFRALPVANIGDAMGRMNVVDGAVRPVWRGAKMAGRAYTVDVAGGDNAGIHAALPYVGPGAVLVVNGHGVTNRALIGELISERLKKIGAAGVVVDGAIRDVRDIEEMGFAMFSTAISPAGPFKNGPFRLNVPVAIGGVVVAPGDIVVGDDDGVAVIPAADAARILEAAEAKHASETAIRASIVASDGR